MELSRIGSDFFRPDIQVRGLVVEQVYHLELGRNPPRDQARTSQEMEIKSQFCERSIDIP